MGAQVWPVLCFPNAYTDVLDFREVLPILICLLMSPLWVGLRGMKSVLDVGALQQQQPLRGPLRSSSHWPKQSGD